MSAEALALLLGLALGAPEEPQPIVLGTFEVQRSSAVSAHNIRLDVKSYSGSRYGELTRRKALLGKSPAALDVDLRKLDAPPRERAKKAHRRCSFAIDCEEPSVLRAQEQLVARYGKKPTAKQIERFVDEFIVKKSLAYGMTPASTVATTHEGDCTEHAVLFTALARVTGHAARFVSGLVLVQPSAGSKELVAYGHAWAEVHDGKNWRRYDPALLLVRSTASNNGRPLGCLSYVPTRIMDDEGPGFSASPGFDVIYVARVQVSAQFGATDHCP